MSKLNNIGGSEEVNDNLCQLVGEDLNDKEHSVEYNTATNAINRNKNAPYTYNKSLNLCEGGVDAHYDRIYKSIKKHLKKYSFEARNLEVEDIIQDVWVNIIETMDKKDFVNLEYIKKVIDHTILNILRRADLEGKYFLHKDDFEELADIKAYSLFLNNDIIHNLICFRELINEELLHIEDPLEAEYIETFLGNNTIPGFEEYAVNSSSKDNATDLLTAKKLGFDSNKRNQYVQIKKKAMETLNRALIKYYRAA